MKARAASAADVAAAVLRHLAMSGAPHVVAPIVARTGSLSARGDGFAVTVYPFIEGRTGREAGLSEAHWRALGALARRLHATSVPPDLARLLGSETYRPVEVDLVRQVDAAVRSGAVPDDAPPEVVVLWNARRDDILATVERTETFGAELRRRGLPLVLCHADLHTWNVIIDTAGALWLIDWDGAVLAHKERDLMFVVGGIGPAWSSPARPRASSRAMARRRSIRLRSPTTGTHGRQDVGSYGARILLAASPGPDDRREDVRIFTSLFEPGEIMDLARASLAALVQQTGRRGSP